MGARLRAARKQARLTVDAMAEVMREVATERERRRLPKLADLRRMIRGWEAGEHAPSERYRLLLSEALGVTESALFGTRDCRDAALWPVDVPDPEDTDRLTSAARNPARVDGAVIGSLAATLAAQRRIEDVIGSEAVVEPASANLGLMLRLLSEARGQTADRLAAAASEASQFAGWLHTATGDHEGAGVLYDQALRLGLQARNDDLVATALSMRGHLAWVTGDLGTMAALSRAAADQATAAGTRTVAIQQVGRALALLGDRQGALRAIGKAEETLSRGADDEPDGLYFYGPAMLTMQRGLILAYLAGEPAERTVAADLVTAGIDAVPDSVRESEWVTWYRAQVALARAGAGDIDEAVSTVREAFRIVSATRGVKAMREVLKTVRSIATRCPGHPAVVDLAEALRL